MTAPAKLKYKGSGLIHFQTAKQGLIWCEKNAQGPCAFTTKDTVSSIPTGIYFWAYMRPGEMMSSVRVFQRREDRKDEFTSRAPTAKDLEQFMRPTTLTE